MIGPDRAFLLLLAGTCGLIWELMRPRFIVPGVLGCAATIAGFYLLGRNSIAAASGVCAAGVLFCFEWLCPVRHVCGTLATFILLLAFSYYARVQAGLAIPCTLFAGFALTFLIGRARRAYCSKLAKSWR